MNSLRDEIKYLFSGQGMPYEKVSIMVAVIITVFFTVILGNNFIKDANVAIIDLDNSKYSHELIDKIDTSQYMKVTAVINTPVEPKNLFYQDKNIVVIYLPKDLEKNRYTNTAGSIGVFYDNTNTAQTSENKEALNEIIVEDNLVTQTDTQTGGITLNARNLFNPAASTSNGETQGFLFFFSSMFFTFATIGMIPRLRITGKLNSILKQGTPFDLMIRILPYGMCLLISIFIGLAILRIWGDMVFSGYIVTFIITQVFYIFIVGICSILIGWTAANPGVASSRMILFIPGGFILGGATAPAQILSTWAYVLSHIFPLTWEFHFVRDILMRGANLADIAQIFGAFLIYCAVIITIFCISFYKAKANLLLSEMKEKEVNA